MVNRWSTSLADGDLVQRLTQQLSLLLVYTRSFVPNWCGCEKKLALRALGWLDRNDFIWRGGTIDVGKPKPMTLWAFAEEDGG